MAAGLTAFTVVATKQSSGDVQFLLQNPNGGIKYAFAMKTADVTSMNTTVNGGAAGTTLSFVYAQDQFSQTDFGPAQLVNQTQ
jgi:hypothetical protein